MAELLAAKSRKLRPCNTRVTRTDGSCFVETRGEGGFSHNSKPKYNQDKAAGSGFEQMDHTEKKEQSNFNPACPGFVVDTKPDLRCSEILPYLFLGSQDVAYDVDTLKKCRITSILSLVPPDVSSEGEYLHLLDNGTTKKTPVLGESANSILDSNQTMFCKSKTSPSSEPTHEVVNHVNNDSTFLYQEPSVQTSSCIVQGDPSSGNYVIEKVHCSMLDTPEFNIEENLVRCTAYIRKIKFCNGRVLVHCNAGVSRAPSVVIAYLMYEHLYDYQQAYAFVKERRSFIRPNDGFVKQLKKLQLTRSSDT